MRSAISALLLTLALSLALSSGCTSTSPTCDEACTLVVHRWIKCSLLDVPNEQAEIDRCSSQLTDDTTTDKQCKAFGDKVDAEACEDLVVEYCPTIPTSELGAAFLGG